MTTKQRIVRALERLPDDGDLYEILESIVANMKTSSIQQQKAPSPAADATVDELRARLDERAREVEELRAELAEFQEQRRQAGRLALAGGSFAARIAAGRGLTRAVKRWLEAREIADSLPVDETADVAAAIVRRVVRVGLVGLAVAALPGALLIWQNILLQMQIRQQAADNLIVRRAQLLDTIYTEECEDPEPAAKVNTEAVAETSEDPGSPEKPDEPAPPEPLCKPKANPRAVREAVMAFVEIERGRGERADLSEANLSGVNLRGANLRRVDLNEADLGGAILSASDLTWADLTGANLSEAQLGGANLTGARLHSAVLKGAYLLGGLDDSQTNLRGAEFHGADLRAAMVGLESLAVACGDGDELPKNSRVPDSWPCYFDENWNQSPLPPDGSGVEFWRDLP